MDGEAHDSPRRGDSDASSTTSSKRRRLDNSPSPRASSLSARTSPAPPKQTEPDEITPIVGSNNGERDYRATATVHGREGEGDTTQSPNPKAGVRRRNLQYQETGSRRSGHRVEEEGGPGEGLSWWKQVADKYGSIELDNKGSTARDHLALERTFLAWLRTSLAFASIGIAITQLFRLNTTIAERQPPSTRVAATPESIAATRLRHVGKPLGATFIAISIVVLFIGFHRYFESQHWIIRGKFPASRGSIVLITFMAGALIVSSLVVVVSVAPKAIGR